MEFLKDGRSIRKRNNFRKAKAMCENKKTTLDEYIHFLMELQKVVSFKVSNEKVETASNKL